MTLLCEFRHIFYELDLRKKARLENNNPDFLHLPVGFLVFKSVSRLFEFFQNNFNQGCRERGEGQGAGGRLPLPPFLEQKIFFHVKLENKIFTCE